MNDATILNIMVLVLRMLARDRCPYNLGDDEYVLNPRCIVVPFVTYLLVRSVDIITA